MHGIPQGWWHKASHQQGFVLVCHKSRSITGIIYAVRDYQHEQDRMPLPVPKYSYNTLRPRQNCRHVQKWDGSEHIVQNHAQLPNFFNIKTIEREMHRSLYM